MHACPADIFLTWVLLPYFSIVANVDGYIIGGPATTMDMYRHVKVRMGMYGYVWLCMGLYGYVLLLNMIKVYSNQLFYSVMSVCKYLSM